MFGATGDGGVGRVRRNASGSRVVSGGTDYACGILIRDRKMLLGRRASHRNRDPRKWDIIGGRVESDEPVDAALIREFGEELDITPTDYTEMTVLPNPRPELFGDCHYHIFTVTTWEGGEPVISNHEHSEIGWFGLADACSLDLALAAYPAIFRKIIG